LKLAWTRERVNFEGKYWAANDLVVLPAPRQQPHPPLLLAANSDETFAYAAGQGLGVIGTTLSQPIPRLVDRLREFKAATPDSAPAHPQPSHVSISFFVAESREKAHRIAGRNWRHDDIVNTVLDSTASTVGTTRHSFTSGVGGWATWDFEEALRNCIYDDPAGCVERLQSLQQQLPGMGQCILEFNRRGRIPSEQIKESMRLFAEKVMPRLA